MLIPQKARRHCLLW